MELRVRGQDLQGRRAASTAECIEEGRGAINDLDGGLGHVGSVLEIWCTILHRGTTRRLREQEKSIDILAITYIMPLNFKPETQTGDSSC